MGRLGKTWKGLQGSERLLVALASAGVLATAIGAAIGLSSRPADVSNPEVAFEAPEEVENGGEGGQRKPQDRRIDWKIYGYDRERTKFLGATKLRPPFRKLWKYDQEELIEFAPVLAGKRMYFIDNDARYVALNLDTGRVVWRKRLGKLNASSPALVDGVLYSVSLQPPQALAVRANDGKVLWRKQLPSRAESSPLIVRGRMLFGSESGTFFALRARDGKPIWETELDGAVKAAPAFADNKLYVGDYAGKMYALRVSDGGIEWSQQDLGVGFGRSGRFYSTPAVAFGRVYVGNVDGRVYSFDAGSGELAWTFSAGDFVYSGIAAADTEGTDPAVFFGSHDKRAYAVDAETGEEIWSARPGGQVSGPATVVGDVVYLSNFTGNSTVGFNIKTGRRVFKFDEGEYGPVVSDGERLFAVGGSSILALKPVKVEPGEFEPRPSTKGIVPPAELRRIRREQGKREAQRKRERSGSEGRDGRRGELATAERRPCRKRFVRGEVRAFVEAINQGSEEDLSAALAGEPAFRRFSRPLDYRKRPERTFRAKAAGRVVDHLRKRAERGDRIRLASFGLGKPDRTKELCNFRYTVWREIGDLDREGERFVGKGAVSFDGGIAIWKTGQPKRFRR